MEDDHQSHESSDRENGGGGEDEALRTTAWDEILSSLRSSMLEAMSSISLRLDGHDHGNSINHDNHDHEHDDQIDDHDDDDVDDQIDDDDDQIDDDDDDDDYEEEFMLSVVPATKSSIEALEEVITTTTSTTKGLCSVCMDDFSSPIESNGHDHHQNENDHHDDQNYKMVVVVRMPCSHLYHKECIVQWLEKSHLCPLCRYAMPTSNL